MTDIDAILKERADQYGQFDAVAKTWQDLMGAYCDGLRHNSQEQSAPKDVNAAVFMILMKVARIACGNPNHLDNWDDIQGYAKLVADRLRGGK